MVCCLCKLHNFCIDRGSTTAPEQYAHDHLTLMDFMNSGESENSRPLGLLGEVSILQMWMEDNVKQQDYQEDESH